MERKTPPAPKKPFFTPCLYRSMGCFEKEAAKIVNPNIEIKHTKLMMDGDPYCESQFIEKESS